MAINRINDTDLQGKLVAQLSNRPTDPRSAGGDNMTAQEVKARHDALGLLVKDRLNKLIDALTGANDEDLLAQSLKVSSDQTIADFITAITATVEAKYAKPGTGIPANDLAEAVQTLLGKAGTALQEHQDISGKADKSALNALADIVKGKKKATVKASYSALVTALNAADDDEFVAGDDIFVKTADVPDVWISGVEDTATTYTYTTDEDFIDALNAGTLQVGYYTLAPLETEKPDLSGLADAEDVEDIIDGTTQVGDAAHADEADKADDAAHATYSDFATQLYTEREIEDADEACPPIVFGTVGGNAEVQSGLMKFEELRGNTILWNQLCKDPTFATASMWDLNAGMTLENNKITMQGAGNVSTAFSMYNVNGNNFKGVNGHIYIFSAIVTSSAQTTGSQFRVFTGSEWGYPGAPTIPVGTSRVSVKWTFNNTSSQTCRLYFYSNLQNISGCLPEGETMVMENLQVFDLTEMFGAGKEPEMTNDFFALFPKSLYAYNAGALLSSKSASLISIGKNQCPGLDEYFPVIPGETYEVSGITEGGYLQEYDGNKTLIKTSSEITSATDITLDGRTVYCKLQATTYGNVMFYVLWDTPNEPWEAYSATTVTLPNLELRSAGSVYDVLYQQGGGKRRVGSYTFDGTEIWTQGSMQTTAGMYRYYLNKNIGMKNGMAQGGWCNKFDNLGANYDSSTTDGVLFGFNNIYFQFVTETEKTSAELHAIFDSSVTIFFPLATETDITPEENPGWEEYSPFDNFGSLQFTQDPAQDIPVPQAYFVRYTVNLVEFLDTLFVRVGGDAGKVAILVPDFPSSNGTYSLKVTVSSGTPTCSWVADT